MAKNRLSYQADYSRHSHDTSAGFSASLCPGAIVPQYWDILGPGDSVYYRTHMFARLQDVKTAFLGEIDLHVDYFFVPLQMIYTPFGQNFAQTDDVISSVFDDLVGDSFPTIYPCASTDTWTVDDAQMGAGSYKFDCIGKSITRLIDALDANALFAFDNTASYSISDQGTGEVDDAVCKMPRVSPWAFCAYQAIYQKYYRNDEFEKFNISSFNVDTAYLGVQIDSLDFFLTRYHQRPSDYFTDARVSPIASAVNKLDGQTTQFPVSGGSLSSLITKVDSFLTSGGSVYPFSVSLQKLDSDLGGSSPSSVFDSVSSQAFQQKPNYPNLVPLSASNIRALFAVDKFARIYGRADKTYDDQILAHFGVKIPHDVKHDLTHLKHYRIVIQSDPVFSTANTGVTDADDSTFILGTVGSVGGQGSGSLDTDQEKFTAPVHGVFMAVAYVLSKPRYQRTFSKLHMLSERLSFPIPEYDKLGAQPIYGFEVNPYQLQSAKISERIAWQNRYEQFKRKYNRCSIVYDDPSTTHNPYGQNIYRAWIINRPVFYAPGNTYIANQFVSPEYFFESPSALDSIMVNSYLPDWDKSWYSSPHLIFQSDPLLTEFMCYCKKVSWMSETGEPDL